VVGGNTQQERGVRAEPGSHLMFKRWDMAGIVAREQEKGAVGGITQWEGGRDCRDSWGLVGAFRYTAALHQKEEWRQVPLGPLMREQWQQVWRYQRGCRK